MSSTIRWIYGHSLYDPHEPWDPPSVYDPEKKCMYDPDYKGKDMFLPIQVHVEGLYTEEELHHISMLYAEKVTMCDKWFGWMMDKMNGLGPEDNTLVLVVSDHGSPMGNGEHGHGIMPKYWPWPYEELAHIPFMMRGPGLSSGKRIVSFVQSCDVAPTVVDWPGIGVHHIASIIFRGKELDRYLSNKAILYPNDFKYSVTRLMEKREADEDISLYPA